jgi:predicted phage-related endonuclease
MKIHQLTQGSEAWLTHRANCFNASDAPAMLGCSQYETRSQLLGRLSTGITPEVGANTQRLFDDGHRFEDLARPLAEDIVGEDLGRVVGTIDAGLSRPLGASFDGITFGGDVLWEHKSLNNELRTAFAAIEQGATVASALPKAYRVQVEQQMLISGAERVLFMASRWTDAGELEEEHHCWYESDPELRAEILSGWDQFDADLRNYEPPAAIATPVAQAVTALPAVVVQVEGSLAVRDNFRDFEAALRDFIDNRLISKPETDQDFVDLDAQIKTLKKAEDALDAAEAQMLAQVAAVDTIKRAKDMLHKLARDNRLAAERALKSRKEEIKAEVVSVGMGKFRDHIAALNERLGKPYMPSVAVDFAGAIKGLKTLESLKNAVDTELARAKIEANAIADRIQINLASLRQHAKDHAFLFADTATIVLKAPDDLKSLITARIAEHQQHEQARIEAERERIRAEEQEKAGRAAAARATEISKQEQERRRIEAHASAERSESNVANMIDPGPATDTGQRIKLGDINALISPLAISADGLAQLGFEPVAQVKAAKFYRSADLPRMLGRLAQHIVEAAKQDAMRRAA